MKKVKVAVGNLLLVGLFIPYCCYVAGGENVPASTEVESATPARWQGQEGVASQKSEGLTTFNEERGNWYLKKQVLQKARRLYEELRQLVLKIEPVRETFTQKRNEIDTLLNEFYQKCGFQTGEIEERLKIIDEEIKRMEAEAQAQAVAPIKVAAKEVPPVSADKDAPTTSPAVKPLGEAERKKLLQELQEKRTQVEKLREEFNFVRKLDTKSVEALSTLTEGLAKIRDYEEQSYTSYEKIMDTINDEVAEDLYRVIETSYHNVQAFDRYVKGEFTQFFAALGDQIKVQMDVCTTQITALRNKGVELNKKILEEKAREEKARLEAQKKKELLAQNKVPVTFWSRITSFFAAIWNACASFFLGLWQTIRGWFGGAK